MPAKKRSRRRIKRENASAPPPIAIASVNVSVIAKQIPGDLVAEVTLLQRLLNLNPQQEDRSPSQSRAGERLDRENPEEVTMRPRRKACTRRVSGKSVEVPEPVPVESGVSEETRTRIRASGVGEVIARTTKAKTIAGWVEIDHQCDALAMTEMIVDPCAAEIDLRCAATANAVVVCVGMAAIGIVTAIAVNVGTLADGITVIVVTTAEDHVGMIAEGIVAAIVTTPGAGHPVEATKAATGEPLPDSRSRPNRRMIGARSDRRRPATLAPMRTAGLT